MWDKIKRNNPKRSDSTPSGVAALDGNYIRVRDLCQKNMIPMPLELKDFIRIEGMSESNFERNGVPVLANRPYGYELVDVIPEHLGKEVLIETITRLGESYHVAKTHDEYFVYLKEWKQ
jgi:hypothetical protein